MTLEDYRLLFIVVALSLSLVSASPTLSLVIPFGSRYERLSEFWVLDPNHMIEEYNSSIVVNETYGVFVGGANHMDSTVYYRIYVKFRNWTQPLPDKLNSKPSPLSPLCEFRFVVADGDMWEAPLTFEMQNVSFSGDSVFVSDVILNGVAFSVDLPSRWDPERHGFYFQLFFELWLFDLASRSFQYHNRYVGIWLNMTRS